MATAPVRQSAGFTLVELSIVLVVIGLLAGGVLVGRDLIKASEVRRTVATLQGFDAAVTAFRLRYDCLPGDCLPSQAASFGLPARPGGSQQGDGNGLVEGCLDDSLGYSCEELGFWADLSASTLISQRLRGGYAAYGPATLATSPALGDLLPGTALGSGVLIGITACHPQHTCSTYFDYSLYNTNGYIVGRGGRQFYTLWRTDSAGFDGVATSVARAPGVEARVAAAIDDKIDDGVAGTGRVMIFIYSGTDSLLAVNGCRLATPVGVPYQWRRDGGGTATLPCSVLVQTGF